jgi:hypothetical protein
VLATLAAGPELFGLAAVAVCWLFEREFVIIERVRTGAWTPRARTCRQFACVAAVSMLVLVVHSVHVHAARIVHDDSVSAATSDRMVAVPVFEPGEFLDHAGTVAGCMTLVYSAPRAVALTVLGAGLLALFVTAVAAGNTSMRVGSLEIARPPPASRRQALLGVFSS